jgi:hypothetical protein
MPRQGIPAYRPKMGQGGRANSEIASPLYPSRSPNMGFMVSLRCTQIAFGGFAKSGSIIGDLSIDNN